MVRDKNVEPFREPRLGGSETTSAASLCVRGSASCPARLSFSGSAGCLPHIYVAHP
jgi:hypothetical protein